MTSSDATSLREKVRDHYAQAARVAAEGKTACCGPAETDRFGAMQYTAGERASLPETSVLASLGCGNPTAVASLREGEVVLDLGSGGGIDVLLSARRVGSMGKVYGLDMTDEMLALARHNAAEAGLTNVEWLKGVIESIPLPAETVDLVISNCVINLSTDKSAVFAEMFRVLTPGGRIGVSDIVAEDRLTPEERAERGSFVGCIAGALASTEYEKRLVEAGFADVSVTFTHSVADGLHSAIVKASKPATAPRTSPTDGCTTRSCCSD
jgi:SAM-dependent methyltransferase